MVAQTAKWWMKPAAASAADFAQVKDSTELAPRSHQREASHE